MYDLINNPYENSNLLDGTLTNEQEDSKTALLEELLVIRN